MRYDTLTHVVNLLSHVAGRDETRPHLACVEITKTHLRAVDGHKMVIIPHEDGFFEDLSHPLYIGRESLSLLKDIKKAMLKDDSLKWTVDLGGLYFDGVESGNNIDNFNCRFPEIDKLVPEVEPVVRISFDSKLLYDLVRGMRGKCNITVCTIEMGPESMTPYKVSIGEGNGIVGVLTPCRISDEMRGVSE